MINCQELLTYVSLIYSSQTAQQLSHCLNSSTLKAVNQLNNSFKNFPRYVFCLLNFFSFYFLIFFIKLMRYIYSQAGILALRESQRNLTTGILVVPKSAKFLKVKLLSFQLTSFEDRNVALPNIQLALDTLSNMLKVFLAYLSSTFFMKNIKHLFFSIVL